MESYNIFDYIDWRGDLTFEQSEFNAIDGLIFSAFSYIIPDRICEGIMENRKSISLKELASYIPELEKYEIPDLSRTSKDIPLLEKMAASSRYGDVKILSFIDIHDQEQEIQLAAFSVDLGSAGILVLYRGTDRSLVGMKEDLNLSYMEVLPGQESATAFLNTSADRSDGQIYLAGHSKGGNFAVFAASAAFPDHQDRIKTIYNYDGPGFTESFIQDEGYLRMRERIKSYVPKTSLVGMLLIHGESYKVVESDRIGLFQHDPYSWKVMGKDFIYLDDTDFMSQFASRTLHEWLSDLTADQKEAFVEKTYMILNETGAEELTDLISPQSIYLIMKALVKADSETKAVIKDTLKRLSRAARLSVSKNDNADEVELLIESADEK